MSASIISVRDVSLNYEGIQILSNISTDVESGTIHAIIGPNGAGKTSLMNCITGYYLPDQGEIRFRGRNITSMKPNRVARMGISRMFQHIEIIDEFSVLDNILLGRHTQLDYGFLSALVYFGKANREEERNRQSLDEIISYLNLGDCLNQKTGLLSYGTQKRVELARAIVMNPHLLILDEPTSGMNQQEKDEIIEAILKVHERFAHTILIIEHDMRLIMRLSDRISVLNFGVLIAEGTPEETQQNEKVVEAYLGTDHL